MQIPETSGRSLDVVNGLFDLKWSEISENAHPTEAELEVPKFCGNDHVENGPSHDSVPDTSDEKAEAEHFESAR